MTNSATPMRPTGPTTPAAPATRRARPGSPWRQLPVLLAAICLAMVLLGLALPGPTVGTGTRYGIGDEKAYAPGTTLVFRPVLVGQVVAKLDTDRSTAVFLAIPYEATRDGGRAPAPRARLVARDGAVYKPALMPFLLPPAQSRCTGRVIFRVPFEQLEGARLTLAEGNGGEFFNRTAVVDLGIDDARLAELDAQRQGPVTDETCQETAVPR